MVKVKIGLNGTSIPCESYKWVDNRIVLYNAEYVGSLWEEVEVFNSHATITVLKGETKLPVKESVEEPEEKPW